MEFFPEASFLRSVKHAGRKAVKAMRMSIGKKLIIKRPNIIKTSHAKAMRQPPKMIRSMIRVGSDCSSLGT